MNLCAKCEVRISSTEPAILAENLYFHLEHFTCDECGIELNTNPYKKHNDKYYCANDYISLFASICNYCHSVIKDGGITFNGLSYHYQHLYCASCNKPLLSAKIKGHVKQFLEEKCVLYENKLFHKQCFLCDTCKNPCDENSHDIGNKVHL